MCWSPEQAVPFDPAEQERHKAKLFVYVCLMQSWQFTYCMFGTHWGGQLTRCASQISLGPSVQTCTEKTHNRVVVVAAHWQRSQPLLKILATAIHSPKQVLLRESAADRGRYVADLWNAGHLRSAVGSSKSSGRLVGREIQREKGSARQALHPTCHMSITLQFLES